jgi:hypothetical protein
MGRLPFLRRMNATFLSTGDIRQLCLDADRITPASCKGESFFEHDRRDYPNRSFSSTMYNLHIFITLGIPSIACTLRYCVRPKFCLLETSLCFAVAFQPIRHGMGTSIESNVFCASGMN